MVLCLCFVFLVLWLGLSLCFVLYAALVYRWDCMRFSSRLWTSANTESMVWADSTPCAVHVFIATMLLHAYGDLQTRPPKEPLHECMRNAGASKVVCVHGCFNLVKALYVNGLLQLARASSACSGGW